MVYFVTPSIMKSYPYAPRVGLLAFALACAFPALAQQQPVTLPEVVVTATRLETRSDAVISDVTVIDTEELQKQSGRTLSEVLTRLAGVQMSANGGPGNTTSVYIRGSKAGHVLLLIDGLRLGSASTGNPSFDNIALESIERIEVLKGPASSLYGSDAVGGVVQIFTKKGGKNYKPSASLTLGSDSHRAVGAGLSGTSGVLRYAVGASHRSENGFSASNEKAGSYTFNPDRDAYRQTTGYLNFELDAAPGWAVDAGLWAANGLGHYDAGAASTNPSTDLKNQTLSLGLKGQITPEWVARFKVGQVDDKLVLQNGNTAYGYDTRNTLLSWSNEVKTPLGALLAGLEQQREGLTTTDYDPRTRKLRAGFIGLTGNQQGHSWQLNLRRDNNSQFGSATTGFAGYSYRFNPQWRVSTSAGTSFKAPSFNDLYYPDYSNPSLKAEKGRTGELGATYTHGPHELKLTRYESRIRDLIAFDANYIPFNASKAQIKGWTLAYSSEFGNTRLRSSLDVLDARNLETHYDLPRRAPQQMSFGVDTALNDWTVGGDLLLMSKRYDDAKNTTALSGFATLDVFANRQLNREWVLSAKVINLTNKTYELAKGYNQAGRSVFVTLRYQPQ